MTGCGPDYHFNRLEKLYKKGRYLDAAVSYERFYNKNPNHTKAPLALLRAAEIYNYKIRLPSKAASLYKTILTSHSSDKFYVSEAKKGFVRSPDYFPLVAGAKWIEVDSATGGNNMKAEWTMSEVSTGVFLLSRKFMAGARTVTEKKSCYKYEDFVIREMPSLDSGVSWIFMEYPFLPGKRWSVKKDWKNVFLTVESVSAKVETRAGTFEDCLKISESYEDLPEVKKYNYYAPYVGWVLTTISSGGRETRNSELQSYKIPGN